MKIPGKLNEKLSGLRGRLEKTPARAFCWAAVIYTVLFAVIAYVFYAPANKLYGINIAGDGRDMYLPLLMNFRRTLAEFYTSIKNGSPEFRLVNFDYCFGSDNYITVFNFLPMLPLYLLTPLFSESSMWDFYMVAQLVLQYLGGIAFIYLCRCYGRDMLLSGLVAPAYAFTGSYFTTIINHPQFNYMVIAFPLMVVGLDRVLERRGWKLLTFGVFFAGFSSFTFLIYTLPFLAVFALLRVWATKRKTFWRSLLKDFLLCMGAIIIGVMLTGLVLLPTLYLLFHSNRGQTYDHLTLKYLLIPQVTRLGSIYIPLTKLGVYAYVMPAAMMALIPLRQKTEYKVYMITASLLCATPLIVFGTNGFMYDGYRWGFIVGLLLCYLAVAGLESFASLSRNDVFYLSLTTLLFTYITTMEHEYVAAVLVTAVIFLLAIPPVGRAADKLTDIVISRIKKLTGWIKANKDGEKRFLAALVLVAIFVPLLVLVSVDIIANNLGWERLTVGTVAGLAVLIVYLKKQTKGLVTLLMLAVFTVSTVTSTIKKDGTKRFDKYEPNLIFKYLSETDRDPDMTGRIEDGEIAYTWMVDDFTEEKYEELLKNSMQTHLDLKTDDKNTPAKYSNNCLTYGVPTVANFHNMMDKDLLNFYDRIGQTADGYISLVNNLGFCGNEPVYSLFGVDTFFSHGYELPLTGQTLRETAQVDGTEYRIINYDYAFPYGVTYDSYMDKSDYDGLSEAYLPFALMQNAYVEGETSTVGDELKKLDSTFEHSFDMESEFFAHSADGIDYFDNTITLTDDVSECFIYLTFEGVTAKDHNVYDFINSVVHTDDDQCRTFSVANELCGWPWIRTCENYCVPLGYKENGLKKIRFLSVFSYDNIRLHAIPRELFEKAYEARTAETLKNVELGASTISGDITVTGDKLLSVCCLHNDGWKVYVDGEQAELCSVNDLFLGVKLGEGSHHVEFRYFTPWLKEGALLSAAGVILLIAADILLKKKTAGRDDKEETKA